MIVTFDDWTQGRSIASVGTNAGATELPFQSWRHFKESFTPELIARAISESNNEIKTCIDPFGGSGTTGLACQFLGVHPTLIEVNPFLSDLIESKLYKYNSDRLAVDFGRLIRRVSRNSYCVHVNLRNAPATFVEPGVNGRWVFDKEIAWRISAYLDAIDSVEDHAHRRLFKVLLGGILTEVSNVVISGKGRKYRRDWDSNRRSPDLVDRLLVASIERAISEIHLYSMRECTSYELRRGDSRQLISSNDRFDIAVFSPPYPNSFDYTDVYNLELWALGYLSDGAENRALRNATMSSHVQIHRMFAPAPTSSPLLNSALFELKEKRAQLWNRNIPEMLGGYFADMLTVLDRLYNAIISRGSVWIVVGDSQYAGIQIQTARVLSELTQGQGWRVSTFEPFRAMRSSAQQGGRPQLAETLLVLNKA